MDHLQELRAWFRVIRPGGRLEKYLEQLRHEVPLYVHSTAHRVPVFHQRQLPGRWLLDSGTHCAVPPYVRQH